ncbi:hypothetical protein AVEN_64561-1 [Araneus ventricosus]|uniref:Uncharacterized protein n=1 Tax=Araneus ventricosus TaxID=182803 RepID=A0A4Y2R5M7_ARAVE|nr:hypothetical protein AVEN_64561-1 [Araneus ventricosus]
MRAILDAPVILNLGQMTRTTPELAPLSLQTSRHTNGRTRLNTTYDLEACNRPHTRRIFSGSGFEPGTLRPYSRDLTTKPPLPYIRSLTNNKERTFRLHSHKDELQEQRAEEIENDESFPTRGNNMYRLKQSLSWGEGGRHSLSVSYNFLRHSSSFEKV